MAGRVWLNVGCGPHPAPSPWVNIDRFDLPHVDVIADAAHLPYDAGSVDRIYAGHVLEHCDLAHAVAGVQESARVLASSGEALLVGPDLVAMAEAVQVGTRTWGDFWAAHGTALRGDDFEYGISHQWSCTGAALWCLAYIGWPDRPADEVPFAPGDLAGWPVVDFSPGQAAVWVRPAS